MTNPNQMNLRKRKAQLAQLSKSECAEMLLNKRQRIDTAYKRLCEFRQRSIALGTGGNCVNADVLHVVALSQDCYVTRDSMHYMLKKDKKKAEAAAATVATIPIVVATTEEHIISTRTPVPVANNTNEDNAAVAICRNAGSPGGTITSTDTDTNDPFVITLTNSTDTGMSDLSNVSENTRLLIPKPVFTFGMSDQTKKQLATTYAAELFQQARADTKCINKAKAKCTTSQVSNGTLDRIVGNVEKELEVESGTLNRWTVQKRVNKGNLTGFNHRNKSPIHDLEMVIAMVAVERSRQGHPMRKDEVIHYARAVSQGTIHARNFNNFMKKERPKDLPLIEEVAEMGNGWYEGFLKRHEKLLKRGNRVTVTDSKLVTFLELP